MSNLVAADVDGDGIRDLIVTAPGLHDFNGAVHLIKGQAARLSGEIDPVARAFLSYVGQPARKPNCQPDRDPICVAPERVGWNLSVGDLTGHHGVDLLIGADQDGIPMQGLGLGMAHIDLVSPRERRP